MRKLLVIGLVASLLFLGACGSDKEEKTENPENSDNPETEEVEEVLPIELKMVVDNQDEAYMALVTKLSESVSEATEGHIVITPYAPNDETLKLKTSELEALMEGTIDICMVKNQELIADSPWLDMFTSWFIFMDYEHFRFVWTDKVGGFIYDSIASDRAGAIRPLVSLFTDSELMVWKGENEGAEGLLTNYKMAINPSEEEAQAVSILGGKGIVVVNSRLYTYLVEKKVNAAQAYTSDIISNRLYEYTDSVVKSEHLYDFSYVMVNAEKYSTLSKEEKTVVEEAFVTFQEESDAYYQQKQQDNIEFIETLGLDSVDIDHASVHNMFSRFYRSSAQFRANWNIEYYERILKLAKALQIERGYVDPNKQENEEKEDEKDEEINELLEDREAGGPKDDSKDTPTGI